MKVKIFDLREINEYFNLCQDDVDLMLGTWEAKFGKHEIYTSKQLLEILSMTLKNILDGFEEKFLETDIYFKEVIEHFEKV